MATLSPPEPEAECHTVAHLITRHELRILEAREPPSTHLGASDYALLRPATEEGAGGAGEAAEAAPAYATVMADSGACLPTERYLDIMVRGAEQAGMDPAQVRQLRETPCVPRKRRSEFARFPRAEGGQRGFSRAELEGHPPHIHYVVFGGQVLLFDSQCPAMVAERAGLPPLERLSATGRWRDGDDVTLFCAVQYYEPRYCEARPFAPARRAAAAAAAAAAAD